jgi:hypothetical protein
MSPGTSSGRPRSQSADADAAQARALVTLPGAHIRKSEGTGAKLTALLRSLPRLQQLMRPHELCRGDYVVITAARADLAKVPVLKALPRLGGPPERRDPVGGARSGRLGRLPRGPEQRSCRQVRITKLISELPSALGAPLPKLHENREEGDQVHVALEVRPAVRPREGEGTAAVLRAEALRPMSVVQ